MDKQSQLNRLNTFLWGMALTNSIARSMYDVAFIWIILDITNSEQVTGFVAMTTYLPAIMFGLFVGSIVDLLPKTKVIIRSTILQGLIISFIPLFLFLNKSSLQEHYIINTISLFLGPDPQAILMLAYNIKYVGALMIIAFFHNGFSLPIVPSFNAYLPTQISKDKLLRANSIANISWQTAVVIGPILAAQFLTFYPVENLFIVCVFFYLLASWFASFVPHDTVENKQVSYKKILKKTKEGLGYLKKQSTIGFMVLLTFFSNIFVMGPAVVGIPIFVKLYLNGSAADFAMAEAFVGIGMLLGTAIMYRIGSKFNYGFLFILGLFIDGISFCLYYFAESLFQFYIFSFMHGIGIPFLIIARVSILQNNIKEKFLGRIFSIISVSIISMTAISSGIIGILAQFMDIQSIFMIFGILAGSCGLVGALHPKIRYLN